VLATGVTTTIRYFATMAFREVDITVAWRGEGANEEGYCPETGNVLVKIDRRYFRPAEVDLLIGNATKAREVLGWKATTTLEEMCREMVQADLVLFERNAYLQAGGHDVVSPVDL
jgi:GDPmannose 4,6-dehydratase